MVKVVNFMLGVFYYNLKIGKVKYPWPPLPCLQCPSAPPPFPPQLKSTLTRLSVAVSTHACAHMCLRIQYTDVIFLNGIFCCLELRHQGSHLQICFSSRMSLGDSTLSKTSVVDMVCEVASLSSGSRFHGVGCRGQKKSSLRAQGRGRAIIGARPENSAKEPRDLEGVSVLPTVTLPLFSTLTPAGLHS